MLLFCSGVYEACEEDYLPALKWWLIGLVLTPFFFCTVMQLKVILFLARCSNPESQGRCYVVETLGLVKKSMATVSL